MLPPWLNPDVIIEPIDDISHQLTDTPVHQSVTVTPELTFDKAEWSVPLTPHDRGVCWYVAGGCLLVFALMLVSLGLFNSREPSPIALTHISHNQCELLASDDMLRSVSADVYRKHFDDVRQQLGITCKPGERFLFFYGDRLETNGLGRVFLAHCAMHEDNPFSYCDNYFYYSWKP